MIQIKGREDIRSASTTAKVMANIEAEAIDLEPEEDDLMDEDLGAADLSPRAGHPRLRSAIAGANDESASRKTKGRGFREEKDSDRQRRLSSRDFESLGSDGGPGPQRCNLENVDESFYGSSDEEPSEAYLMNKDTDNRREKFHMLGYRDGISAGQEAAAQEGYNIGYKESVLAGYKFGIVRGVSSALVFLPDELREKMIDEQETRDKFQKLHGRVNDLSTETAMKLFYGALTTKQGVGKSGEEGPGSSFGFGADSGSDVTAPNDLGSYVTELSSLLDKSPKIKVGLDT